MSPKYETNTDHDGTEWRSDREYVFGAWETNPWHEVGRRYDTVKHRLVARYDHGVGVDLVHEVRSDDDCGVSNEWTAVETLEIRDYGVRHYRHASGDWWE